MHFTLILRCIVVLKDWRLLSDKKICKITLQSSHLILYQLPIIVTERIKYIYYLRQRATNANHIITHTTDKP